MDNGRRKYDNEDNPEPEDFGRRENNGIIIDKKRLYNMLCSMKDELNNLQVTLDNGIVEAVEANSEKVEKLSARVEKLQENMKSNEGYYKGTRDHTKKMMAWAIGIAGWVIALLVFLFGDGVLM